MVYAESAISVFSLSMACGHSVNEDAFVVKQHPRDLMTWVCTLADGQGGRSGGAQASKLACDIILDLAQMQDPHRLMETGEWSTMFRTSDDFVSRDSEAGFTTLIGLCLRGHKICGGSNGDSAVAVFDATRDCVALTGNQIKNPPVGSGDAAFVPFSSELEPPWMILVMTDGVWKYATWERIKRDWKKTARPGVDLRSGAICSFAANWRIAR